MALFCSWQRPSWPKPRTAKTLKVIYKTGRAVTAFAFTDDHEHYDETGEAQFDTLKNGETAIAHVPTCKFSVVLFDHDAVWHWEFHDCNTPSITFTDSTGHGQRHH